MKFEPVTATQHYQPALDGLRAVAALTVLLAHCDIPGFGGGLRGVDVFFVLSGYLITGLIKKEMLAGTFVVWRFWWNRAVRLFPALALVVLAYLVFAPAIRPFEDTQREALLAISYTTNFSMANQPRISPLGHTWSLAVEEHFYLVWPLALTAFLAAKRPAAWLIALWLALSVTRVWLAATLPWEAVYFPTYHHATGLILGAAVALSRQPAWLGWPGALALALVLSFIHPMTGFGTLTWATTVTELATAAVIAGVQVPSRLTRAFAWEPLRLLGVISYGIYLWHWPFVLALPAMGGWPRLTIVLVGAVSVATISFVLIERPIRQSWRLMPRQH